MAKRNRGKKAHRRIDTQDATDFLEQATREERQGLVVDAVPDADLFFVDKAGDEEAAAAAKQGRLSRKLAARQKVLRSAAILAGAHAALPAAKPMVRKPKGSVLRQQQLAKQQQPGTPAARQGARGKAGSAEAALDLWGADEAEAEADDGGWTDGLLPASKRPRRGVPPGARRPLVTAAAVGTGPEALRPAVPAVEVDPAGCSYNPDPEAHQEAVAVAVAAETRKLLDRELQPAAPPRTVDWQPEADELALLQTFDPAAGGAEEAEEPEGDEDDAEGVEAARRKRESERKTRKDRNRDKRRREAEEAAEAQRRLKAQRHELSSLTAIQRQLAEEAAQQEAARLRRQLDREERLASEPPKLGKQRFQPMPLQVLTSDEVGAGLRRLKPTAMLARDRFKSLQKRGVIEPRRRIEHKKQGKKVEYVQGERAERAAERHAELRELKQARKQAGKKQRQ